MFDYSIFDTSSIYNIPFYCHYLDKHFGPSLEGNAINLSLMVSYAVRGNPVFTLYYRDYKVTMVRNIIKTEICRREVMAYVGSTMNFRYLLNDCTKETVADYLEERFMEHVKTSQYRADSLHMRFSESALNQWKLHFSPEEFLAKNRTKMFHKLLKEKMRGERKMVLTFIDMIE